jgi:hypothetical protein
MVLACAVIALGEYSRELACAVIGLVGSHVAAWCCDWPKSVE